jgi:mannose-6-phosphate isomerase-like protein (cupin superfamily)
VSEYVIAESAVAARRDENDTAETRVVFDRSHGCERLAQRVIRFLPGRSAPRGLDGEQEIVYVVSGTGRLLLEGETHLLEPGTGAFLVSGETYRVENRGPEPLLVVSVLAPQEGGPGEGRRVTVRFSEQEELRADAHRTFRYLVDERAGCAEVTQFVGLVQPSRAPEHSHPYDEVGYVVEGSGFAHVDGVSTPIGPGSCFHLPPGKVHCIENSGPGVMRILGVFHPAGSPAERSYERGPQGVAA